MREQNLSGLLGNIYDAATNVLSWTELGNQLCAGLAAERVYLGIPHPDGTLPNLLQESEPLDIAYSEHYHKLDPFRGHARIAARENPTVPCAILGANRTPSSEFLRSEYYADYARRRGARHCVGARLDTRGEVLLGIFRESNIGPFTAQALRGVELLLPHLHRGLQLSRALATTTPQVGAGLAALDTLRLCVFIVDASMRIVFANAAAERLAADRSSGLRMVGSGGVPGRGECCLFAGHAGDAGALKALVAATAANGPGGALRLRAPVGAGTRTPTTALLVSPVPARLAAASPARAAEGLAHGLVMVIARNLATAEGPPAKLLSDLFGLSPSEAEVATLVLGGATAETVAQARHVSLDTVRRQIQMVLRKAEALNLRDFERMAASLALMQLRASEARG